MIQERYTTRLSVYILFKKQDQILLYLRQNTGYADNLYSIPAGHVEADETIKNAAIREAYEETGAIIAPENLKLVHTMYRTSNYPYVEFYWLCTDWQGTLTNTEPEKCGDLAFYPLNNLPKKTSPYLQRVLKHIENGIYFSEEIDGQKPDQECLSFILTNPFKPA